MSLINFRQDVFSASDVGLVRKANEDNCYTGETPNGFLFIVCDGMGGHVGGAKASAIGVESIANYFLRKKYTIIQQALSDALLAANNAIFDFGARNPELSGMGTTACVVLMQEDKVWFAHVGDSRIYLYCNKQRRLHRLTKDHSVVQGLVDQGVISEQEAEVHPNKNRILRTLGVKNDVQPEVCAMPVLPANGDIFLICSDGLTGMVPDEVLQHILSQNVSLPEKGEDMLTMAKQAGGTDNITVQLLRISNSPHMESIFESKNSSATYAQSITPKPRKKGKTLRTILLSMAILLLAIVAGLIFSQSNQNKKSTAPGSGVDTTTVTKFAQEKPAWQKEVDARGYNFLTETDQGKVYGKKLIYNSEIDAIVVYPNEKFDKLIITLKANGSGKPTFTYRR